MAGYKLIARNVTAYIAIAKVSKQAGNGLRRGTHGKPFPCTVCGMREQKNTKTETALTCFKNLFMRQLPLQVSLRRSKKSSSRVPYKRRPLKKGSAQNSRNYFLRLRRLGHVCHSRGADGGQFQRETCPLTGEALDADLAAVFCQDLLAHRQAETRAAALLRRDKGAK